MSRPIPAGHVVDQPPMPEFAVDDWLWVKQIPLPMAGMIVPQHSHEHDHVTGIVAGVVDAWCDGRFVGRLKAPKLVTIKAGTKHVFQAVTDGCMLYCIHNLRGEGYPAIRETHELVGG